MSINDDALNNLKQKLAAHSESEDTVALASVSAAKYVFTSLNKDWEPEDHPRDPNTGEFVKGPTGYIFGKTKSAMFSVAGAAKKVDLKPGDVAFKSALGNLIVSHADGSYSLHPASGGAVQTIPAGNHSTIAATVQNGAYKKVGENLGTVLPTVSKAKAEQMLAHPEQFDSNGEKSADVAAKGTLVQATDADLQVGSIVYKSQSPGATAWEVAAGGPPPGYADGPITYSLKKPGTTGGTTNAAYSAKSLFVEAKPLNHGPKPPAAPKTLSNGWTMTVEDVTPSEGDQKATPAPVASGDLSLPEPPALKPGKTKFTAKQYAAYQAEAAGAFLATGSDGQPILSGSWVDLDGKPYLVHASPHGSGSVTAYRWVSTKQQASNLEKEDVFTVKTLSSAKSIPDPTGKPYGVPESSAPAEAAPKHGSLMAAAVNAAIPNTATVHKKHVAANVGKNLYPLEEPNQWIKSGDWVEIDGKPVQVHSSPNEGNVAIAKWVSTKQQASNNTYDFPASVLATATKISDPSGKPYSPLTKKTASSVIEATLDAAKKAAPTPDPWAITDDAPKVAPDGSVAKRVVGGVTFGYTKKNGKWTLTTPVKHAGLVVDSPHVIAELEASASEPEAPAVASLDLQGSTYTKKSDGLWYVEMGDGSEAKVGGNTADASDTNQKYVEDKYQASQQAASEKVTFKNFIQETVTGVVTGENGSGGKFVVGDDGFNYTVTPEMIQDADDETYVPENPDPEGDLADWEKELLGHPIDTPSEPYPLNSVDAEYLSDLNKGTMVQGKFGNTTYYAHKSGTDEYTLISGDSDWKIIDAQTAASVLNTAESLMVLPSNSPDTGDVLNNPMNYPVEKKVIFGYAEYTWRKDGWYNADGMPQIGGSADALDDAYETKQALQESILYTAPGDQVHLTAKTSGKVTIYEAQEDGTFLNLNFLNGKTHEKSFLADYLDKQIASNFNWQVVDATEKNEDTPPKGQQFVHPVSGVVFPLSPGDEVYKHKTSEGGYIVVKVDDPNPINFFTTNGKQQKPKASQKNLDHAYELVNDWPGKVETTEDGDIVQPDVTPGQSPTKDMLNDAAPGDAAYSFKDGAPHTYWTKAENGDWIDSHGVPVSHQTVVNVLGDAQATNVWTYGFYPKGTSPDTSDDGKAPWGGDDAAGTPQVDPEPISTKPEPAPKKGKKAAKPALPKKITLPTGKEIDLKPGEAYGKVKDDWGTEYYVHVTAGPKTWQNTNNVYNTAGSAAYWEKAAKWTPTSLKSAIKKNGGELYGENSVSAEKIDFSQYEATTFDATEYSPLYKQIQSYVYKTSSEFPVKTYSGGGVYHYQSYEQFEGKNWSDLDTQEKLSLFADYEPLAGKAVASLEPVAKMDLLDKSDKQDFGKARSGLTLIHRSAVLARELNNPDTDWDDDRFEAELAFVASKVAKPGVSLSHWFKMKFPIADFYTLALSANKQRQFKNTLTGLDFDPYDGTTEEYDAYAKSKGFPFLAALTPAQQKAWVLIDLGDPTKTSSEKAVSNNAADIVKSKIAIANLAADLQKGHAKSPLSGPQNPTKGIFAKMSLKSSYAWETSTGYKIEAKNTGHDSWLVTTTQPDGTESTLDVTDAMVAIMVNKVLENGNPVTESDNSAYGENSPLSNFQKLEAKHGVTFGNLGMNDLPKLQSILGQEGGGAATAGGNSELMVQWLWAHAAGDEIAKYNIEVKANYGGHPGPNADTHLGNPNSTVGKAAHKALAEYLWMSPQGQKWLNAEYMAASEKKLLAEHLGLSNEYVDGMGTDNFNMWAKNHPQSTLSPYVSGGGPSVGGKALKPINVPNESWNLVNSVEGSTDLTALFPDDTGIGSMTDAELTSALSNSTFAQQAGLSPYVGALPIHLKRLALWGAAGDGADEHRRGILYAVAAKAKAGEYMDESTPAWVSPSGAKYPMSPGASVYKIPHYSGDYYVVTGPPKPDGSPSDTGWRFIGASAPVKISGYSLTAITSGQEGELVFTMPNPVQWDQAKKDNPDFHEAFWTESSLIEEGQSYKYKHHESGALLTAALKNNTTLEQNYPHLYALHKHLPENVRQAVLAALEKNNYSGEPMLAVLEYKASKGHYASMGSKGLFDANQPWLPFLSKGQMSEEAVNNEWSPEAKSAYAAHFKVPVGSIGAHLTSLLNPETPTVSKALPDFKDLVLTKTGKTLGGMHTKHVWVDQDGNEWMSKAFNSDPNAKARVDAETGAVRIGKLFGFRVPAANTQSVPGYSYAYLQHLAPATGDLTGKGPNDLSLKQLQQAMEEHVLDWIVSNHDTHRQNLMVSPNGDIFGIDKGQAFKHFPKDKLAHGYLPPENGEKVWYDNFYAGVKNGQVSKETADEVTKYVLRRAQKISKDQDDDYRAELETALQHRTFWPDQYPNRDAFIGGLLERKHNLFNDFVDFYKSVYADSPYDFDIDTENLVPPKLDDHTHIAVSQDYADDVSTAAVHGKSMFFSSSHLDDSHIIMTTAKAKGGSTVLTGEAKILKDGDDVLVNWLQKQTIESHVGAQPQSYNDHDSTPVDTIDPAHLPGNTEWFSAMVGGSKTVSSHNASGDHAYNQGTLKHMEDALAQVETAKALLIEWQGESNDPFKGVIPAHGNLSSVVVELHTHEQQNAWADMLDTYIGYAEKVNAHKNTDAKISPHFQQTTYSPSKSALDLVKAKQGAGKDFTPFVPQQIEEILKNAKNGDQITMTVGTTDTVWTKQYGGWLSDTGNLTTSSGVESVVQATKNATFGYSGVVPAYEPEDDSTSATVTVGTKVLKVVKRANAQQNGHYDFDSGEQQLTGGETSSFSGGWSLGGHMYEIDFGNTVIEYRPHASEIPAAQRGLLRFRKKDWDGNADSIDEIFDVLRHVGLDLDPANESSMELFYWKHLHGVLRDRKDGKTGKWAKLHDKIVQAQKANSNMTVEQELVVYKEAWSEALGADVVENADWLPKFSRQRIHANGEDANFTSGHPYWHRPDYSIEDIKKWQGGSVVATSLTYGSTADDALPVALSGSMLSAEERARYYGSLAKSGASTASDSHKGSSGQVYTKPSVSPGSYEVIYHPKVLLRTDNYAYAHDAYGDPSQKSQSAYWDGQKMITETTQEMMVKHAVSVMDDIIMLRFPNEAMRAKAIKAYKDRGITKLHGLPIEEIFVTSSNGFTKVKNHVYTEAMKNA